MDNLPQAIDAGQSLEVDAEIALPEFFETLYESSVSTERALTIFAFPGNRFQRFTTCASAAEYVFSLPSCWNIYHAMATVSGSPAGRGSADDAASISSVWVDIDKTSAAHPSDSLPTTTAQALELLYAMPLKPNIIVDSGHGLHGYWLFDQPWIFRDANEREQAKRLAKGWHGLLCDLARRRGWKLENLGDLARVLRTPNTVNNNAKSRDRPRVVARWCDGELHSRTEFLRHIPPPAPPIARSATRPIGPHEVGDVFRRCLRYLDHVPPAIEGQEGGTQTLLACRAIFRFGLKGTQARRAFAHYNAKCVPPWTDEAQIEHKLDDAWKIIQRDGEFGILATGGNGGAK